METTPPPAARVAHPPTPEGLTVPDVLVAVGVDPGRTTALVALEVPIARSRLTRLARGPQATGGGATFDVDDARWLGAVLVRPSTSAALSVAEQKAELFERARLAVLAWAPQVVALEEPLDAGEAWVTAGRRDGRRQGRSTAFLLGEHYGLALAAAKSAAPTAQLASYPVNNHGSRPGWMQAGAPRPRKRGDALTQLRLLARVLGGPGDPTEDQCMALGVLLWHLQTSAPPAVPVASTHGQRRRTRAVEVTA